MSVVDEELLTPEGMADAHMVLTTKYQWFVHIKPTRKFEPIKRAGLQPRKQGCRTNSSVAAAIGRLVANVDEMIFLRPIGDKVIDSTPRRGEKMFAMAISGDALPEIITVDWTFGGTWGLASIIKKASPELPNNIIFCEVVRRRGSVAIYETIPANLLSIWTKGLPFDDPSKWPRLLDTEFADVVVFC
jgi:hypothetical protein